MLVALLAVGLLAPAPLRADEPAALDEGAEAALPAAPVTPPPALVSSPELEAARSRPLADLGAELASADVETRLLAYDALRTLRPSRVDEVEERLRELRTTNDPPSAAAFNTLVAVRHHMGSERADDPIDLALGLRQLLGAARVPSVTTLQVAERMALLRGLEHMDALAADRVLIGFFQRGWAVWQWEARHLVGRRGLRMLPALIEGRSAGNPEVRRWAVGSIRRLGVDSVGAAVQMASPEVLPDVLRAFASLNDLNAMPAVITFVDHPDPAVREASRAATASYERNAIWQLRLAYRNKLGENADLGWSWQTTMQRLFDGLDARRLEPAHALLAEGLAAAEQGDWATMRDRYERALRREPLLPRRVEMAPGYAAEALAQLASVAPTDELRVNAALTQLRRALRLAPEDAQAPAWRATVAFHEAERARVRGVLDEGAYEAVLAAQPQHEGAQAVLADIEEGGVGEVEAPPSARWASLLGLAGVLLLVPYARLRPLGERAAALAGEGLARARERVVRAREAGAIVPSASEAAELGQATATDAPAGFMPTTSVPREPEPTDAAPFEDPPELSTREPSAQPGEAPTTLPSLGAPATDVAHTPPPTARLPGWARACGDAATRNARRLAYFVASLARRLRPAHASASESSGVLRVRLGHLRTRTERVVERASRRLPAAASVVKRAQASLRPALGARDPGAPPRVPKLPTLRELGSTLSMLASPEPPEVTRAPAPRAPRREPSPRPDASAGAPAPLESPVPASPPRAAAALPLAALVFAETAASGVLGSREEPALDADALSRGDVADLDDLLFGDDASSSPGFDLAALAAYDTSPGLLEAPDTIPG